MFVDCEKLYPSSTGTSYIGLFIVTVAEDVLSPDTVPPATVKVSFPELFLVTAVMRPILSPVIRTSSPIETFVAVVFVNRTEVAAFT